MNIFGRVRSKNTVTAKRRSPFQRREWALPYTQLLQPIFGEFNRLAIPSSNANLSPHSTSQDLIEYLINQPGQSRYKYGMTGLQTLRQL